MDLPRMEKLVFVSVLSPNDMAMSAFLNRVASLGGFFVCSQQILTQAKSSIMSPNGKAQAQIQNIHTIRVPKSNFEELYGKPYNEFDLVESAVFFKK
jgi:hypothetical protein